MRLNWRALLPIVALLLACVAVPAYAAPNLPILCPEAFAAGSEGTNARIGCGGASQVNQVYREPTDGDLVRVNPAKLDNGATYTWKAWRNVAAGEWYQVCGADVPVGTLVAGTQCGGWPFIQRTTAPVAARKPVCLPVLERVDVWNIEGDWGDVPASIAPGLKYAVWRERAQCSPDRKIDAAAGSFAEAWELVKLQFKTDAEVNAWVASQPVVAVSPELVAFLTAKKAQFAATLPAVVGCRVPAQSETVADRPVYKPNAAGTGAGSALSGVRVAAGTPCGARLGSSNYYSVTGQMDTQGRLIEVDAVSIGVPVQ